MADDVFQLAYQRARSAYSKQAWLSLTPSEISAAIYREVRAIDLEASTKPPAPPAGGGEQPAAE